MREVAVDSTHGTNAYNFQLTTVMVIDDHGEGYPAAFCYSNRTDEVAMAVFFSTIKRALESAMTGVILMTDDAEAFANAWVQVMGPPAHRLLCVWHVDRAWRKNLAKIEGDGLLKATVYKTLRTLMEVSCQETFQEKLQQFLEALQKDKKTMAFADYFCRQYANRPELWAYCFRIGLRVHHNMHLEAMHRVLKHVHLQGRKVKRMDRSLGAVMSLLQEKNADRLLKTQRGKYTKLLLRIRERHRKGLKMNAGGVTCLQDNLQYMVPGKADQVYLVEQVDNPPHEPLTCALRCTLCGICTHSFTCTCLDSGLRNTICKHIHRVMQTVRPVLVSPPAILESDQLPIESDLVSSLLILCFIILVHNL